MGDVGSTKYELAQLPPCPTIRVLSYSNCQRSNHHFWENFQKFSTLRVTVNKDHYWPEINDDYVVRAGTSVTWNALSWSEDHQFKPRSGRSLGRTLTNIICSLIFFRLNPRGRLKWPYTITRLTASFMCGLMSDVVKCKFRKSMVIHDTKCPHWDQVSLNNANETISVWIPWQAVQRSGWKQKAASWSCLQKEFKYILDYTNSRVVSFLHIKFRS